MCAHATTGWGYSAICEQANRRHSSLFRGQVTHRHTRHTSASLNPEVWPSVAKFSRVRKLLLPVVLLLVQKNGFYRTQSTGCGPSRQAEGSSWPGRNTDAGAVFLNFRVAPAPNFSVIKGRSRKHASGPSAGTSHPRYYCSSPALRTSR